MEKAPAENLAAMLVVKLLPFMENLSSRKWSDSDILEDIDYVKERLQENFQSLTWVENVYFISLVANTSFNSTFEQYASEIETGKLEWSPPHKSETFWKENYSRLEEHNYQLLRYEHDYKYSLFAYIVSKSTCSYIEHIHQSSCFGSWCQWCGSILQICIQGRKEVSMTH